MNIELDEVVGMDVSDDALEMAADASQGGKYPNTLHGSTCYWDC